MSVVAQSSPNVRTRTKRSLEHAILYDQTVGPRTSKPKIEQLPESRVESPKPWTADRRPRFDELPFRMSSDPQASAWGLYGEDDELGTLNLLTPEVRREAWKENRLGLVIPLNLPLDTPRLPMNPRRKACCHRIIGKTYANDDELDINTQGSSHWDGLRHYPYQNGKETRFYNDASQADITGPKATERLGIQNMAKTGIAGRAVLLDWRAYAERQGITYSPFEAHAIPLDQLLAVAKEQKTEFKKGDILLVRTGWTKEYLSLSADEQIDLAKRDKRASCGVQASREMLEWHWENAFAAVASDTNAYEQWPSDKPTGVSCHEVFLSGWGMPIGEVWDLEALARTCREHQRWEFYLTSAPLYIKAGVASPANVLALL